jgi:hypothetical protein
MNFLKISTFLDIEIYSIVHKGNIFYILLLKYQ